MRKAKKGSGRSRRYTDTEKAEILAFARKFDEENGKGGQSAAVRRYKVTLATLRAWKRAESFSLGVPPGSGRVVKTLVRMTKIALQIEGHEAEIKRLRVAYDLEKATL